MQNDYQDTQDNLEEIKLPQKRLEMSQKTEMTKKRPKKQTKGCKMNTTRKTQSVEKRHAKNPKEKQ